MTEALTWRATYVDFETGEHGASCEVSESMARDYIDRFPQTERIENEDGSVRVGAWLLSFEGELLDSSLLEELAEEIEHAFEMERAA